MVYAALLAAMIYTAYKFSRRFALLVRRLIGLLRERQRVRLETASVSLIQADSAPADAEWIPDRESIGQQSKRSR